jgi:nitroreductase
MDKPETELDRIIRTRRSVRKYKPEAPPAELVDAVVRAGLLAPTGRKRQSSVIVRIDDPELKAEIVRKNAEIMGPPSPGRGPDPFYGAPVMLLVIADASADTAVCDGSLALGYMMLKAHELGLASCWIHRAKEEFDSPLGEKILARLGLEGRYVGVGHLALGYADGPEPPPYEIKAGRYRTI